MRHQPILLILVAGLFLTGWGHRGPQVKIGLFYDDWSGRDAFVKRFEKELQDNNADLVVLSSGWSSQHILAGGMVDTDFLFRSNVQAIVVFSDEKYYGRKLAFEARARGIPILSVERPLDGAQDFLVAFDPEKDGQLMAEELLKSGSKGMVVLSTEKNKDWFTQQIHKGKSETIQKKAEKGEFKVVDLSASFDKFSAILFDGSIDFLERNHFQSKNKKDEYLPNCFLGGVGQGLATCRAIASGKRVMTIYHSPVKLAEETAYLAAKAARKAKEFDCQFVEIPNGKGTVRTVLLTPKVLEAKDLEGTVIKDGVWTREEIFGKK